MLALKISIDFSLPRIKYIYPKNRRNSDQEKGTLAYIVW